MSSDRSIGRYRRWYARLLRLYPRPYRDRFAEPMAQTLMDVEPGNLMYVLVLVVAIVGASIARFEPREASLVMFATAISHARHRPGRPRSPSLPSSRQSGASPRSLA